MKIPPKQPFLNWRRAFAQDVELNCFVFGFWLHLRQRIYNQKFVTAPSISVYNIPPDEEHEQFRHIPIFKTSSGQGILSNSVQLCYGTILIVNFKIIYYHNFIIFKKSLKQHVISNIACYIDLYFHSCKYLIFQLALMHVFLTKTFLFTAPYTRIYKKCNYIGLI